jgi:hypothetical protein
MTTNYLTFDELQASTDKYGENGDCTVKALAQVTGISYEKAHNILRKLGRKGRKGTSMNNLKIAVRGLGFGVKLFHIHGKTIGNCFIPRSKRFLIETASHVIAARDGKALDYTDGGRFRIKEVWEIIPDAHSVDLKFSECSEQVLAVPRARVSTQRKWKYTCPHGCEFNLSTTLHNKALRGQTRSCSKHKARISYGSAAAPAPSKPSWINVR